MPVSVCAVANGQTAPSHSQLQHPCVRNCGCERSAVVRPKGALNVFSSTACFHATLKGSSARLKYQGMKPMASLTLALESASFHTSKKLCEAFHSFDCTSCLMVSAFNAYLFASAVL